MPNEKVSGVLSVRWSELLAGGFMYIPWFMLLVTICLSFVLCILAFRLWRLQRRSIKMQEALNRWKEKNKGCP